MLKPTWNPKTNQFRMDGDCETTTWPLKIIKNLVHQPVETTKKQWLFKVPVPNLIAKFFRP